MNFVLISKLKFQNRKVIFDIEFQIEKQISNNQFLIFNFQFLMNFAHAKKTNNLHFLTIYRSRGCLLKQLNLIEATAVAATVLYQCQFP